MNWSDGINLEEGHAEVPRVRMTSELTTVYVRQLLGAGWAGRLIPHWPLK